MDARDLLTLVIAALILLVLLLGAAALVHSWDEKKREQRHWP